jgi:Uma2 family endonuclease
MSLPAHQSQPLTFEEVALLNPKDYPGDLIDGVWVPVSRNTLLHGEILIQIGFLLKLYVRDHPGWIVSGGDPGMKLRRNPDTLRGADIAVVRAERRPTGKGAKGWLDGGADLAVEIVGDSETTAQVIEKATTYLAAGTRMAWVVEPSSKRVVVITPPNQYRILKLNDILDGGDVLPGFSCSVAELFE